MYYKKGQYEVVTKQFAIQFTYVLHFLWFTFFRIIFWKILLFIFFTTNFYVFGLLGKIC